MQTINIETGLLSVINVFANQGMPVLILEAESGLVRKCPTNIDGWFDIMADNKVRKSANTEKAVNYRSLRDEEYHHRYNAIERFGNHVMIVAEYV